MTPTRICIHRAYAVAAMALFASASAAVSAAAGPTQAELDESSNSTSGWLMTNKSYDGHRYVSLSQINAKNVANLREVCSFDTGVEAPAQSTPVLYAGRVYFTAGQTTFAVDGKTCKEIWSYEWTLKGKALSLVNRGPAIKDGRLVRGTADGFLIALSMDDGKLLWQRQITSQQESHYLSMPPTIVDDRIIYGTAGADWGGRGWIGAFALNDGAELWRYEALPRTGDPGAQTWGSPDALAAGGGSFWTPVAVDRARQVVFVAIGNPAPDFFGESRQGSNAGSNTAAALDIRTGKLLWSKQFVAHDTHDWDLDQIGPLLNATVRGKVHDIVIVSGKDGRLRVVDRDDYGVLADLPISKQENADAPATVEGVHICPGLLGGQEWSSSAYDPERNIVVAPMVDWCGTVHHDATAPAHTVGQHFYGGRIDQDPIEQAQGVLAAIDMKSATVRWKVQTTAPMLANVTATRGGVIFAGDLKGTLYAVDADRGEVLLRYPLGASAGGGLFSYELDDRQYVAAISGPVSAFFGGGKGTTKLTVLALP